MTEPQRYNRFRGPQIHVNTYALPEMCVCGHISISIMQHGAHVVGVCGRVEQVAKQHPKQRPRYVQCLEVGQLQKLILNHF